MHQASHQKKKLLLNGQKLKELRGIDDSDDRRYHICGAGEKPGSDFRDEAKMRENDPWQEIGRSEILKQATAAEPQKRVALVCEAGLGKTTTT